MGRGGLLSKARERLCTVLCRVPCSPWADLGLAQAAPRAHRPCEWPIWAITFSTACMSGRRHDWTQAVEGLHPQFSIAPAVPAPLNRAALENCLAAERGEKCEHGSQKLSTLAPTTTPIWKAHRQQWGGDLAAKTPCHTWAFRIAPHGPQLVMGCDDACESVEEPPDPGSSPAHLPAGPQ